MSSKGLTDSEIGEVLLIRAVQDQMSDNEITKHQPLTNVQDQDVVDKLAQKIKKAGAVLDNDEDFNSLVNNLASQGDPGIFSKLKAAVFSDGVITCGKIFMLLFAVGKLAVFIWKNTSLPGLLSELLLACLKFLWSLLAWINSNGGWISSISSLTQVIHSDSSLLTIQAVFLTNFISRMRSARPVA